MAENGSPTEERQVWDRREGEPLKWYARFDLFRLMKPWKRSINAVYEQEVKEKQGKTSTKIGPEWYEAAKEWKWQERAEAWDIYRRNERDRLLILEEEEILKSEYAVMHKRVELLNRKAKQLEEITDNQEEIWVPDVKSIGTGPNAQRVDLVQFNDSAFRELREFLTDIADEKGERVKMTKQEHSGSIDIAGASESLFAKMAAFRRKKQDE
jgi:hypothetical protein